MTAAQGRWKCALVLLAFFSAGGAAGAQLKQTLIPATVYQTPT